MLRLSVRPGDRLEDAGALDVHVAGSEANVAYAAARVGLKSAWASVLPNNPLGKRVAATLGAGGVDTSPVRWVEGGRLGLYFVELGAAPRPISVVYDRANSTMARAKIADFDWPAVLDTQVLHVSGITLGLSDSCRELATHAVREARSAGVMVTFDVNYRQKLWDRKAAATAIRETAQFIDVLVCTEEDARDLFGTSAPASGWPRPWSPWARKARSPRATVFRSSGAGMRWRPWTGWARATRSWRAWSGACSTVRSSSASSEGSR